MPMHDWTRARGGLYHSVHLRWIAAMMDALNAGLLPSDFYAAAELKVSGVEPDVVALSSRDDFDLPGMGGRDGRVALATPKTSVVEKSLQTHPSRKTNRIAIRHGDDRLVAVIELVSPGNKDTKHALKSFCRKTAAFIRNGVHVLVVDPFAPGRYDRHGLHRAIWENVTSTVYEQPTDKPLTVASYQAGSCPTAYIEPFAIGTALPAMPLFLTEEFYITVPLEESYQTTWAVLPSHLRDMVSGSD